MSDKWFRGERDPPKSVIGVVSSVASYPACFIEDMNVTRVVMCGQPYELVVCSHLDNS
jgi:hypothetical protein